MAISISNNINSRFGVYVEGGSLLQTLFDFPINSGATVDIGNKLVYRIPQPTNLGVTTKNLVVSSNPLTSWVNLSSTYLETFTAAAISSLSNLSGLVFPSTIKTVAMPNCASINDYIDVAAQKLYKLGALNLSNAAISQPNIDAQLASFVSLISNPLYTGSAGTIDLSGGLNATPSTAGLADVATLSAAGFNVIVNLPAVLTLNSFTQTGCSGSNQLVTANTTISGYSNVNIQLYMSLSSSWMDGSMWSVPNLVNGNNSISLPFGPGAGNFTKARLKDYTTNVTGNELNITLTTCP